MAKFPVIPIDVDQSLIRHVPKKFLVPDMETGEQRFSPYAFWLREGEPSLSASWVEHFDGVQEACVVQAVKSYRRVRTIKKNDAFAVGKVGDIVEAGQRHSRSLRVVHEGSDGNPSHAAVRRIGPNSLELAEQLAAEAWCKMTPNAAVPL